MKKIRYIVVEHEHSNNASYSDAGEPLVGGTAINLGADGSITDTHHIYYE